MSRRLALVALVLLLAATVAPVVQAPRTLTASEPVSTTAFAVAQTSSGLVGVGAQVHATVVANGTGEVFVSTKPLAQTDMQGSARIAARVAASTLGQDWQDYDYFIVFKSRSVVIGGPSAGAVMTLALTTALHNLEEPSEPWTLDEAVGMTGTINPDGTIGPVGGIPEKAEAAADRGVELFLFPAGQRLATRVTGPDGQRSVVNVPAYCADQLKISCKPVATIRETVRMSAGVELPTPETPTPTTRSYARILGPLVRPQAESLDARIQAARAALENSSLSQGERNEIEPVLRTAEERLGRAQAALGDERFYTTATMAFQGKIAVGHAENLTRFFASSNRAGVVQDAIGTCQAAVTRARNLAYPLNASTMHALYAVGAAQRRVAQGEDLLQDARSRFDGGTTTQDWVEALRQASFCTERARTVHWWAGLRDAFGPGPSIDNPRSLATEVVELARERVTYAQAVLRSQEIGSAPGMLETAENAVEQGRFAQAVAMGAEAQSEASLAVQAVGGSVPGAVVEAARDAVKEAVARSRADGVEPIMSVALFELSKDVDDNRSKLSFLWTARSLATLRKVAPADAVDGTFVGQPPELRSSPRVQEALWIGLASGGLAGALVVGIAAIILGTRRPDRGRRP